MDAGSLRVGDVLLLRPHRRAAVTRLAVRQARQTVYNFQVEGVHTYAVGTGQVLVHNKPVPANFPPLTPAGFAGVRVPTAIPFKPANPAAVVNSLPGFVAGQQERVFGILVVDGKAYYLRSGISEATETVGERVFHAGVARNAPFNFPTAGANGLRDHVEGAAASLMYKLEAKEATLYLNLQPCGRLTGVEGCWNNLGYMIPADSKIRVFFPSKMGIHDMLVPVAK